MRAKKRPIDDDELELILSEIIRGGGSGDARMKAVRELRNLRTQRKLAADPDEFAELDELQPRRTRRAKCRED